MRRPSFAALLLAVSLVAAGGPAARAVDGDHTIRPELAKPLQAAQQAIQGKSYAQALAKLKEADAVAGRTPYEDAVIAQLRLIAALGTDDLATAAHAFDIVSAAGTLAPPAKQQFTLAMASGYFRVKDYAAAATWANRALASGGADPQAKTLLVQALYLDKQYGPAGKAAFDQVQAEEKQGRAPPETLLQILAASAREQQDWPLYETALRHLVAAYPKPDYWADLLHRLRGHAGVSDRLALDVARLTQAVGLMTTPQQYMDYAELAVQAGLPGEAQAVVDKGYAAGVLGSGADAPRHARLRELVRKAVDADRKSLDGGAAEAARAATGDPLVATGLDYWGYGAYDKAASLIEQGIAKGGLKSADEARLHLGLVYLAAGNRARAVDTFKAVKAPGTGDLAALWILQSGGHAD